MRNESVAGHAMGPPPDGGVALRPLAASAKVGTHLGTYTARKMVSAGAGYGAGWSVRDAFTPAAQSPRADFGAQWSYVNPDPPRVPFPVGSTVRREKSASGAM
jgi:hypothetical protein